MEWFLQHVWEISGAGVLILFGVYIWLCVWKIYDLKAEIKKVLAASEFVGELEKSKRLAAIWSAFKKTLIGEKYSTTDAAEFFTVQNLTRGMNMSFWQNYGGIFTGLGILGTFAGLTFGLSGVDMTSGDVETLKRNIAQLLSGVESAFVTSLVGILAALIYSFAHYWLMKNFQKNTQRLAEKLDETYPRRSAENFLADINAESQSQTAELKNLGGQIASGNSLLEENNIAAQNQITELQTISTDVKNIGEQVAEAIFNGLDEKLETYVEQICAAIEELGKGAASGLNDTMSKVAGAQMDRFSSALDKFSDSIDKKLEAANEISKIMNEQMLNTLKDLSGTLKQQAEIDKTNRDTDYKKFSETLEGLIGSLNEVADKIKTQQADTAQNFETLLKNGLGNFNAGMTQILAKSKKTHDETAQQNKETYDQFLATLVGLSKTLQDITENSKKQQQGSINNFDALIKSLINKLEEFTNRQKDTLNNAARNHAEQIFEAVRAFREIVNAHNNTTQKMFAQVQSQLNEASKFLQQVNTAGNSLRQAAEPVRQSTQQITSNLIETSAQMKTLSAANQITRENLSELSNKLRTFVSNFDGIAKELETSTNVIKTSLENYNSKMNDGMIKNFNDFDKRISDAVGHLKSLLEDLSDALDDFNRKRR